MSHGAKISIPKLPKGHFWRNLVVALLIMNLVSFALKLAIHGWSSLQTCVEAFKP